MFGQLYELAKQDGAQAFRENPYALCPHTDENLKEGWLHGFNNADRDAQEAEAR